MFWGAIITNSKAYKFPKENNNIFHISNATVSVSNKDSFHATLYLEKSQQKFILCKLSNDNEVFNLDHYVTGNEGVKLSVDGTDGVEVHLTGYVENEELNSDLNSPSVKQQAPKEKPQKQQNQPPQNKEKNKADAQVQPQPPKKTEVNERKGSSASDKVQTKPTETKKPEEKKTKEPEEKKN